MFSKINSLRTCSVSYVESKNKKGESFCDDMKVEEGLLRRER